MRADANNVVHRVDLRAIHVLIARGDLDRLRREVRSFKRLSVPRLLLDAAIAQHESRMERCRVLYERALEAASPTEFPYVLDLIAPFLLMDGAFDRYDALRERCEATTELAGSLAAVDAIAASRRGDHHAALRAAQRALDLADTSDDEFGRGRILQRLAYAAFHRADFGAAADLAERSARTLELVGAQRAAATAYSIAYNVHHAGTGDFERAEVHAAKLVAAAHRSGDVALENVGLIAQYEMACEAGDEAAASALRRRIDTLALPQQYAERFARGVGDVIFAAFRNDLAAFHANAVLLRDVLAPDRPTIALASALQSLGAAAIGNVEEARRCSRNALGLAALSEANEAAHNSRYRMLARALAASTCVLIGDSVRAQRATVRHVGRDEHGVLSLVRVAAGVGIEQIPRRMRGYARVVNAVREAIRQSHRHSHLSDSEFAVLVLLARGLSAPQIAAQTGRSVHTIRAHTRSIIAKFGVSGRAAAVAHAQAAGLLQ